jgi:hypothetical protein
MITVIYRRLSRSGLALIDSSGGALTFQDDPDFPAGPGMWDNYPHNLPRDYLIHHVKGHASECMNVERIIADAFPDEFPYGDGEVFPADQRVIAIDTPTSMAMRAAREIESLRAQLKAAQE